MLTKLSFAGWSFMFASVLAYVLFFPLAYCHYVVLVVNHRVTIFDQL